VFRNGFVTKTTTSYHLANNDEQVICMNREYSENAFRRSKELDLSLV
jgi:hypothetical protein